MDDNEITESIVRDLGKFDDPEDLILELCQKTGRSWPEVETLVRQVQSTRRGEIAARQFPLLFVLAFGIFAAGLALVIFAGVSLLNGGLDRLTSARGQIDFDQALLRSFREGLAPFGELAVEMLKTVYTLGINPFSLGFLGVAMILGSLFGMRDTWAAILDPNRSKPELPR
jgi:hypothetical protein